MDVAKSSVEKKISARMMALDRRISDLSLPHQTNTYKRQEEQRHRDHEIQRYRMEQEVLTHISDEAQQRELTRLERALAVGTFFEDMVALLGGLEYRREHDLKPLVRLPKYDGDRLSRLARAGITTESDLEAALEQFAKLRDKAVAPIDPAVYRLRDLEFRARLCQDGDVQFTPPEVARKMVQMAQIGPQSRVLEPEAGIARLADEARKLTEHVDCIERRYDLREVLKLKGYPLIGQDLLETSPRPEYDVILMNPPFSDECRHIRHAFGFLRPGGVLLTLCSPRMMNPKGKKYAEFFAWLDQQDYVFTENKERFEATKGRTLFLTIEREKGAA